MSGKKRITRRTAAQEYEEDLPPITEEMAGEAPVAEVTDDRPETPEQPALRYSTSELSDSSKPKTAKGKGKARASSSQLEETSEDDQGREEPPHFGPSAPKTPSASIGPTPGSSGAERRTPYGTEDTSVRYARELYPVGGPVDSFQYDPTATISSDFRRFFRTTVAISEIKANVTIQPRYFEALRLGYQYLMRPKPSRDYRSLRRTPPKFYREIMILDQVAQGETVKSTKGETGYIVPASYQELSRSLEQIRLALNFANLLLELHVPKWGATDGDWKGIWASNDYEILTVCYRKDVEDYLIDTHRYVERNHQGAFILKPEYMPVPYGRGLSGFDDGENLVINPMFANTSISRANSQENIYSPRQGPDYGKASLRTRPFSYLSSPLEYAPTISMRNILTDPPPRGSSQRPAPYSHRAAGSAPDPGGEPSDGDSEGDYEDDRRREPRNNRDPYDRRGRGYDQEAPPPRVPQAYRPQAGAAPAPAEQARFDLKLKLDAIPEWDGQSDTLGPWIIKLNTIAQRSQQIYQQLGSLVPLRLKKSAEAWYFSLPNDFRMNSEENWGTLRKTISGYYMNRTWISRQKELAEKARYRQTGHSDETPSEYYIRKSQLLNLVYTLSDQEIIDRVMRGAPDLWTSILTTHLLTNLVEFQAALKHHEDSLIRIGRLSRDPRMETERRPPISSERRRPDFRNRRIKRRATVNLVGWSPNLPPPAFPKDDKTISKGKTPEQKGARPCRHCGSTKHWDKDCKYARQAKRQATANTVKATAECKRAQAEYNALYYAKDSDSESDSSQSEIESSQSEEESAHEESLDETTESQDFCEPSQISALHEQGDNRVAIVMKGEAQLGGNSAAGNNSTQEKRHHTSLILTTKLEKIKDLLTLKHWLARPPGTTFLGSQATRVTGWLGEYNKNPTRIIADSGADITLISHQAWKDMENPPRIKTGEQIALVEVTGTSTITGFVTIPIFFDTDGGPVELKIDAYIVKDMISPFILGNDFADQYCISIMRTGDKTFLQFGESGRRIQVENSVGPSLVNEEGHCFSVVCEQGPIAMKIRSHRRAKRERHKELQESKDKNVRAINTTIIPPETCVKVPVKFNPPTNKPKECVYVEKTMYTHKNADDVYGCADSIINAETSFLHVSNFSKTPVRIHKGQSLGIAHNPKNWLDRRPNSDNDSRIAHARFVQSLAKTLSKTKEPGDPNPPNSEVVEGGPKTAETPEDITPADEIFKVLNLSPDLTPEQTEQIKKVVLKNISAFGVDGRLGNYDQTLVEFPMKSDAKPVSLPPFGASSPEKRRVIDEQMDAWLKLEVIEPSVSPWGAPAFIIYRQNKPRMVIDYRKLNELIIPDEFPLPRQDDILQTLTGSNWLSTLDALAGFTQLQIKPEDREKTAFRTHRGLYQFRRMPFGFRNGPAVFQRVMQNILAPFLWVFALVYIDDIVIFSKTFEEHLVHLDEVFRVIAESGITLSPKKCNLGYHSLQLLGQKVSRLGLSTVKEKVDAILQLEEPRNIKELQTFLGMMVYFSSYIPYYAWIVAPLFKLLKKNAVWEWTELQQEAFDLSKEALANSPVRGYAIPGLGYRIYTDACDYGIAAILQQVQPIQIRDLHDTRIYQKLQKAHDNKEDVPRLVISATKDNTDLPPTVEWNDEFEDTIVYIERVIAYWSRTLKPAERNYSPTEREALALKDGLIKFQGFVEGEPNVVAVTDHAALTWARTYQNVNRRLLTWGTIFAAYPNVKIMHRAGRVHSNVDPISRLRRRIPYQEGPAKDGTTPAPVQLNEEAPKPEYGHLRTGFEAQVLHVALKHARTLNTRVVPERNFKTEISLDKVSVDVTSNANAYLVSQIGPDDLAQFVEGYHQDSHYRQVLDAIRSEPDVTRPTYPQYTLDDDGLIRFDDARGCSRICVPANIRNAIMADIHDRPGNAAHGGYHKTYNRIAATYYWPRMARDIKKYSQTCDICQKIRPRRHAAYGLLQPIPIPTQPFEVITMDFIMELPESEGYDGVLVIVDKLTRYAFFIPVKTTIDAEGVAALVFKHIVVHYGLPRQIISDRDARWTSSFWKVLCEHLGVRRAFTTAHHPQADGQTEVMNQLLEITLRAFIGPERDNWSQMLDVLQLSYNTSVHTTTKYTPAYLLRGYEPVTASLDKKYPSTVDRVELDSIDWVNELEAARNEAADSIRLAQAFQQRAYNRGRLNLEFEVGDQVLFNPHTLDLLRNVKGKGKKLLARYEGPFEIMQKISPLAYRLRMPASYGINPILNIAHLERYESSPLEFGDRPKNPKQRLDFEELPEFDVEGIIGQERVKVRGRWKTRYLVKFEGYEEPEWVNEADLQNAPDVLYEWKQVQASKKRAKVKT